MISRDLRERVNDVGVTHTDAVHFIDLFNYFLDAFPNRIYAITRDHFQRGLEDTSIVIAEYDGILVKVESGYVQPGKWRYKVVPNAMTTKEIFLVGSNRTIEADFETESVSIHDVHHELRGGVWTVVHEGTFSPNVGTATTLEQLCVELDNFLSCVRSRETPMVNVLTSGVRMALIMEKLYESAGSALPVEISY